MKKTFSIYILALLSFIGSINTLLQTEEKTTTLDEALSETDCEPDCIYKYPYLQNDHGDVQEKLEPTSIETIQPSDSQTPIQPEQSPSEVLEEGEERFILESEACYKFDLRVEEEPAPKDEACYEIVIPPPTVVVVKGSDLQEKTDSPLETQVIPENNGAIPYVNGESEGPLPETPPLASQNQQLAPQNPNEALPRTIESQTPPPEAVPFILQNPEVIPPPEETTRPYEAQELPLLPSNTAPQPREGPVEIAPQVPEEIPPSDRNQEQSPVSQEQEVPPNDTLVPQSNEQSLPIQTHEEIPPRDVSPPSDERVAIPPPTECEVVSNDHPEVVVIVERPESVNIHYGETQTSPDRAAFGRRRQQFPLQEGWGDRYPNEEFDNPSQDAERGPEILPGFEQEPQVEPVPSPELEERKPIGNQVNNGPEYPESLNRIGEARQGEQELIPFEEGQALESNGQEIGLPPRIPADIELPPFIREESFEIEGIPAENHEGRNTPDEISTLNPEPPLPSSGEYKDASELESFGSPSERPEDTLWQDRREEIPFEQVNQEVTNSGQEISNLHPSVPTNQEIQPDVIEGQFENEGIPVEENQGVVHYDEEVYHQDEDSPLSPEIPSDLKGKANLRGYPSVEELQRGNPQDQREHAEPLNEPEDIIPYYGGEHVEPEAVPRQPEGDFIPFEAQEVINYDEEAYNNPQQDIPPEIEREIKEAIEYVSNDRISTGTTQIYGQPTTYLTYETYDRDIGHEVAFTYVLTNIYSGIFKTDDYHYVVYGAGALNFYNSHYGPQAEPQDTPSCSCNCNYQGYTFNYSFNL